MNFIVSLGKGLRHVTRSHPKPRMLPDDVEGSPRELNPLRERAPIGVVESAGKVVLEHGRRKTSMHSGMFPIVVVSHTSFNIAYILVGEGHHTRKILAQILGGEVTRQGGLKILTISGAAFERQVAALAPSLLQLLLTVIQPNIFPIFNRVVYRVVPIVVSKGCFLFQCGKIHRFHLQQWFHEMYNGQNSNKANHQSSGSYSNMPSPTLFPSQKSINCRDNDDCSQNHIA